MSGDTPPMGTRLILASEDILEQFGTRSDDGRAITAEWGEPDEHGWYSPTFTITDDGFALIDRDELERLQAIEVEARALVKDHSYWLNPKNTGALVAKLAKPDAA